MLKRCLLFLALSSFILPLFVISYTFAHEATTPKTLSGLTVFWLFMPFFIIYLYRIGRVQLPLFLPFFFLLLTFSISGFSFKDLAYRLVDREGYLVYLYLTVITYLTFLTVYNLKTTAQEKKVFLGLLFGLSLIEAITGLLQHKGYGEFLPYLAVGTATVSGTLGYSNYVGFFLSLGIVSAFFLWLEYEDWFKKGNGIRGVAFLFMVGFVFSILDITASKAGFIDMSLGLMSFLLLSYRVIGGNWLWERRWHIFYFFITLILAALITEIKAIEITTVAELLGEAVTPVSTLTRVLLWLTALSAFKDYPLTGIGLGNYSNHLSPYMAKVLAAYPSLYLNSTSPAFQLHVHNDYLEILSETGILGFAALCLFGIGLFGRSKRFLGMQGVKGERLLKVALISLYPPFFFDAFVSLILHYFPFLILLAFLMAQTIPDEGERSIPLRGGVITAFILISVLSAINLLTFRDIGRADINLEKGFRTRDITYLYRAMENPLIRSKAMPFYGQLLFLHGEYRGDRRLMEEGLKVMKDYYAFQPTAQVAHIIGQYYIALKDREEAVRWWQQGLKFHPKYGPILHSLQNLSAPGDEERENIFEVLKKRLKEGEVKAQPLPDNKKNH